MESTGPTHLSPHGANLPAITVLTTKYSVSKTGFQHPASTRLISNAKSVKPSAYQCLPSAYRCLPKQSTYHCLPNAEPGLPQDYIVNERSAPALGGWEDFQDLSAYCVQNNHQPSAMDKFTEGSTFHIEDELNTPDVGDVIDKFNFNHSAYGEDIPIDDSGLAPFSPLSLDMNELYPFLGGPNTEDKLGFGGNSTNEGLEKEPRHMVDGTILLSGDDWGLNLESEQVVMGNYIVNGGLTTDLPECSGANLEPGELMNIHIEQLINANPVENNGAILNRQGNREIYGEGSISTNASIEWASTMGNKGIAQPGKQAIRTSKRKMKNIAPIEIGGKRLKKDTPTKKKRVYKSRQQPLNFKEKVIKTEPVIKMEPVEVATDFLAIELGPDQVMEYAPEDMAVGSEQEIGSTEESTCLSGTKCDLTSFLNLTEVEVEGQVGKPQPALRLNLSNLTEMLNLRDVDCISTPEVAKLLEPDPKFDLLSYVFDNNKKLSLNTLDGISYLNPEVMFPTKTLETDAQVLRVLPMMQPRHVKLKSVNLTNTTVPPATAGMPLLSMNIIGTGVKSMSEFCGKRRPPLLKKLPNKPISGEEDDGDDEGDSGLVLTEPSVATTISTLLLNAAKESAPSRSTLTPRASASSSAPVVKRSSVRKRTEKKHLDYEWYKEATPRNGGNPSVQSSSDESTSSNKRPHTSSTEETGPVCHRYRQLRSKNNEASRKSRLNRKVRDRQLNDQACVMTRENVKLKIKAEEMERLVKRMREALLQAVLNAKKS